MGGFEYGPIELYLVGLGPDGLSPRALGSLTDLADRGVVRPLDLLLVSKDDDGAVSLVDVDDDGISAVVGADLKTLGIIGEDDVTDLAEAMPAGSSAALVALELTWAKDLASGVAESGGEILAFERIPAPVVNALVDALANGIEDEVAGTATEGDAQ